MSVSCTQANRSRSKSMPSPTHDTAQSMPSYSVSRETQQQMNS
ncbi:Uncharacterised protein [Vibrio cholerae]|nr:Uncharacterised protein [Vibrio cholerae]